jgi:probable F420-dependent oxidoreductase
MRIGTFLLPLMGPADLLAAIGRAADEREIDSLWIPEPHLLIFSEYESVFPYSDDGKMPEEYGTQGELDGFLALSYLAAVTERTRLGIGVCIVPQRNPVYTAKDVTTLDHLSNGRFDLGVGIGWLAEEFHGVGVDFANRAARCRDHLAVMQSLWADPIARHEGQYFSLPESHQEPRPLQAPHPPIHFGGNSRNARRRVADLGQGWIPWGLSPEEARRGIDDLCLLLEAAGRAREEVQVSVAIELEDDACDLARYAQAGVEQIVIVLPEITSVDEVESTLDEFSRRFVEPAHRL